MPQQDVYHEAVKKALMKDGWTITHDPLTLTVGRRDLYVDLGAEQPIAAEKAERKIAGEVKSFLGPSVVYDLEQAIGQYHVYRLCLAQDEPQRCLYLAIPERTYEGVFREPLGQLVLNEHRIPLIVFDSSQEASVLWIT